MDVIEVDELLDRREKDAAPGETFSFIAEEASGHATVLRRSQFRASVHGR
ncbi:MAG: hypothetical protein MAG715_00143 [Methanonatronarchaeales archaeon]|nr:hypothetical protein [Methanonatronarchaeales archaeon]